MTGASFEQKCPRAALKLGQLVVTSDQTPSYLHWTNNYIGALSATTNWAVDDNETPFDTSCFRLIYLCSPLIKKRRGPFLGRENSSLR